MKNKNILVLVIAIACLLVIGLVASLSAVNRDSKNATSANYGIKGSGKVLAEQDQLQGQSVIQKVRHSSDQNYKLNVGLLTDAPLGDKSFNDTMYEGVVLSQMKKIISGGVIEGAAGNTTQEQVANAQTLVNAGYGLIVLGGFNFADAAVQLSSSYPEVNFVIVDSGDPSTTMTDPVGNDNLRGLTYRSDQAAYLTGYASAWAIYYQPGPTGGGTGNVGVFGGVAFPSVVDYMKGYYAGVQKFNADTGASIGVVGWDPSIPPQIPFPPDEPRGTFVCSFADVQAETCFPWFNLPIGKAITDDMVKNNDVKVIFPVAGGTGLAVFDFWNDTGIAYRNDLLYKIGVDSDWSLVAPDSGISADRVLSSALKNLHISIQEQTLAVEGGSFKGAFDYVGTVGNNGSGYAELSTTVQKRSDLETALEDLIQQIILGGGTLP